MRERLQGEVGSLSSGSEAFYQNFELFDTEHSGSLDRVRRLYQQRQSNRIVSGRVLDMMDLTAHRQDRRCKTVLVEREYVDRIYSDSYLRLYARAFRRIPRRCLRFHFFDRKISADFFVSPSLDKQKELQNGYLGYSVIYPAFPHVVGRTVISPPVGDGVVVPTAGKFGVNIAGYDLEAKGVPFLQQDGRVMACATCALWMGVLSLSRRFSRIPAPFPGELTELALRNLEPRGHAFSVSPGLSVAQMKLALNMVGYDAVVVKPSACWRRLKRSMWRYLASSIPVILVLEMGNGEYHAVTVVGGLHSRSLDLPVVDVPVLNKYSVPCRWISDAVDALLVNDDQSGPYRIAWLMQGKDEGADCGQEATTRCQLLIERGTPDSPQTARLHGTVASMIFPLPRKVFILGGHAQYKALRLFRKAHSVHEQPFPEELVLHTYLVQTNRFKDSLVAGTEIQGRVPPEVVNFYRGKAMYRLAWITEFLTPKEGSPLVVEEMTNRGEVLLDTTSMYGTTWTDEDDYFLTIHLLGRLIHMDPDMTDIHEAMKAFSQVDESPYGFLWRALQE